MNFTAHDLLQMKAYVRENSDGTQSLFLEDGPTSETRMLYTWARGEDPHLFHFTPDGNWIYMKVIIMHCHGFLP